MLDQYSLNGILLLQLINSLQKEIGALNAAASRSVGNTYDLPSRLTSGNLSGFEHVHHVIIERQLMPDRPVGPNDCMKPCFPVHSRTGLPVLT